MSRTMITDTGRMMWLYIWRISYVPLTVMFCDNWRILYSPLTDVIFWTTDGCKCNCNRMWTITYHGSQVNNIRTYGWHVTDVHHWHWTDDVIIHLTDHLRTCHGRALYTFHGYKYDIIRMWSHVFSRTSYRQLTDVVLTTSGVRHFTSDGHEIVPVTDMTEYASDGQWIHLTRI